MKSTTAMCIGTVLALNIVNLPYASATNTITFNGQITDATCNVSLEYKGAAVGTDGTGSIALDEVSMGALAGAGSSAGQVPFYIVAKDCTLGTPAKTKIAADFKSEHGDNQGNLNNIAANPAENVQLRLLDSARKPIRVNDPMQTATTAFTDINSDLTKDTKMLYFVEYYSSAGTAGSGAVSSDVQYELMYQ
ncbi:MULTISPECIES: fimbrial protein [Citrobacter]|uniref:fimbrial protein n=1 Tax=Citrobacter TaxID=544 RepID=UPI000E3BA2DB|nr:MULTISPECIES: fimbrial protein [Citrobacter]MBD0826980.1 type 1 fimbrial protein [Citrobacter sp. C1]RFU90775.1 type 1 fimbrial protein [Citrobacter gillenii]